MDTTTAVTLTMTAAEYAEVVAALDLRRGRLLDAAGRRSERDSTWTELVAKADEVRDLRFKLDTQAVR